MKGLAHKQTCPRLFKGTRSSSRRPGQFKCAPPVYILKPRIIKICIGSQCCQMVCCRCHHLPPPNVPDPQSPSQSLLGGGTPNPNFSLKFHPFFGNVPSIGVVGAEASPPPFFPPNGATSVGRPTLILSALLPHNKPQNKQRKKEHLRIFPLPPIPYPLNCRSLPFLARLSSSVSSTIIPPCPTPSTFPPCCCPKAVKLILLPLTPLPSALSYTPLLDCPGGTPDTGLSPSPAPTPTPNPGDDGDGAGERLLTDTLFTRTNCPCTRTVWRLGVGGGRRCVVSGSGSGPLSKAKLKDEGAVVEVVVGRWKSRWGRGGAGRFGGLRERGERGGILFFGGVFGRG